MTRFGCAASPNANFPRLYVEADQLSAKYQRQHYSAVAIELLGVMGACLIGLASASWPWAVYAREGLLLLAVAAALYHGLATPEQTWYSLRSLAESLKTMSWRFSMRAEPYNVDDATAKRLFIDRVSELRKSNEKLFASVLNTSSSGLLITPEMQSIRDLDASERIRIYMADRIDDQLAWYSDKAERNRCYAHGWTIALMLALVMALITAYSANGDSGSLLFEAFATLAMSLITWIESKRFVSLSAAYDLSAYEISALKECFSTLIAQRSLSAAVADAEQAFSKEHTRWLSRVGS